jgi:hypothetical protein
MPIDIQAPELDMPAPVVDMPDPVVGIHALIPVPQALMPAKTHKKSHKKMCKHNEEAYYCLLCGGDGYASIALYPGPANYIKGRRNRHA